VDVRGQILCCHEKFLLPTNGILKKHGKKQTLDTLINEEALLLAKYLRNEIKTWNPRMLSIER